MDKSCWLKRYYLVDIYNNYLTINPMHVRNSNTVYQRYGRCMAIFKK